MRPDYLGRVMFIPKLQALQGGPPTQSFFLSPMLLTATAARASSLSHQLKPISTSCNYSFWFPKLPPGQGSANYDPTQSQYFGKAENTQYVALYRKGWLTPHLNHKILHIQIYNESFNSVIQFLEIVARVLFNRRKQLYLRSVFKSFLI